ncbi:MAG: hypothetical protein PHI23_02175 [Candidatus Peribacteraceae bacterium]|nr:hypothetical protein [Candidatus Peribacteraceae bacterium]
MRKFSLLLGALGGMFAGYLFSNKRLREELARAQDPEAAARLLGRHLQRDGKNLARQVQDFVESDEVQRNIKKAKKYALEKVEDAKRELGKIVSKAEEGASDAARGGVSSLKKTAKSSLKKAKMVARRAHIKVRKLS